MLIFDGQLQQRVTGWLHQIFRIASFALLASLLLSPATLQAATPFATSSNPDVLTGNNITFTPNSAGFSVTLTLAPDSGGTTILNFFVTEGPDTAQLLPPFAPVTNTPVAPNLPPTLNPIPNVTVSEDSGQRSASLVGITSGAPAEDQPLAVTARSSDPSIVPDPVVNYVSPNTGGSLLFMPAANANGSVVITVTVNDGQSQSNLVTRSFAVTVTGINDAPTLGPIAAVAMNKNALPQTVPLVGISAGAADEVQTLTVSADSSNPGLIPHPGVNYSSPGVSGSITLAPAPDRTGSATITVTVSDGAVPNGSVSRSFTVTVYKANSPPTLDAIGNVTMAEDSPTQIVPLTGIGPGGGDDPQPIIVTAISSNPGLIPNPVVNYLSPGATGGLRITPALNATGNATITVTVNDGQSVNNLSTRSFAVTVTGVNDAPTISNIPNRNTGQNASTGPIAFTVNDVESSGSSLTLSAISSNPTLVPPSGIVFGGSGSSRTITLTPAQFQNGSSTITITVRDPDGSVASDSFVLSVTEANIPPTLDLPANLALNEDAGPQTVSLSGISAGGASENQPITVTVATSNPGLIPTPTVQYASPDSFGAITFRPAANASGSATITVRVDDGQSQNNAITRSFVVTVTAINDTPTISHIANQRVEPNLSTPAIPFTINDAETASSSLRLTVESSNPGIAPTANIVLGGNGSGRTVMVKPASGVTGSSTITITVSDNVLTAATSFQFTVEPGNSAPSISQITNQTGDIYHKLPPVEFIVADAESDPDSLIVTASSFNPRVLPDAGITVEGSGANRRLQLNPVPDLTGYVTIALTVSDGKLSARSSFMLTIETGVPPTDSLIVEKEGGGSIAPDLNGQMLTVGKSYTMAAAAAPGQVFAGWSGGITSSVGALSFTMASNLVLRARFMTNPFTPIKGTYNGLFFEPDAVRQFSSGFFTLAATDRGSFSGKLVLAGKSLAFRGNLDFDLQATVTVPRPGTNALNLRLNLGVGRNPDQLRGQISDGIWFADVQADRSVFHSVTNPAPFAGAYTLAIPGRLGNPLSPEGDGVGTLKVDGSGIATFAGALADGTKLTQRVPLSRRGEWPLYLSLYTGKGSLLSWLTITNRPSDDITGLMSWIKTSQSTSKFYPGGFTNETVALGSRYTPPGAGQRALNLTEGNLLFSKGNLDPDFVNRVALSENNRFSNLSQNKLTLTLTASSGLLKGTATDPATGKSYSLTSVVLQKQNTALGFLLGTNRSSQVVLFP